MMTWYDDVIMRTIIDLPGNQLEALDAICAREQISRAEAIRRAVELLVKKKTESGLKSAFGLWRDRDIDGLEYERRMRTTEWSDDPLWRRPR